MRDTEALQRADAAFFRALLEREMPALEAQLAVDVASGSGHNRAAFLEAIRGGTVTFTEIKVFLHETVIRLDGPGTGILIGRTAMSFSGPDGAATEVPSRYTHVRWSPDADAGWNNHEHLPGECSGETG